MLESELVGAGRGPPITRPSGPARQDTCHEGTHGHARTLEPRHPTAGDRRRPRGRGEHRELWGPSASPAPSTTQPGGTTPPPTAGEPSASARRHPARALARPRRRCSSRPATSVAATRPTTIRRGRWFGTARRIATLGDTAYEDGTSAELNDCFGGSWGAVKDRVRFAVMGNHDIHTDGGAPLEAYMGDAAARDGHTWFSDDLGSWHVIVLDGNCGLLGERAGAGPTRRRGCVPTSRQAMPGARRAAPPAPVQQRPARLRRCSSTAVGCALRGERRPRARWTRSRLRALRAAGPERRGRRRTRHRRDHRGHRRRRARGVQGSASELAGQDQRHLRGVGAHASPRRLVVALCRRRRRSHDDGAGTCH